jgi:hypothetical protein
VCTTVRLDSQLRAREYLGVLLEDALVPEQHERRVVEHRVDDAGGYPSLAHEARDDDIGIEYDPRRGSLDERTNDRSSTFCASFRAHRADLGLDLLIRQLGRPGFLGLVANVIDRVSQSSTCVGTRMFELGNRLRSHIRRTKASRRHIQRIASDDPPRRLQTTVPAKRLDNASRGIA